MHPRAALEAVVYYLDRSLADHYKVRAYQRAIDIIDEVGDENLADLHARGALEELDGIGKATAGVIADALDGKVPAKLVKLEAQTRLPVQGGDEVRAAIKGDCHMHSTWSDGGASIATMAHTARALGHAYIVMTDHSPRLTVAHGLNADRLRAQMEEIDAVNATFDDSFRVLTGIEVDILEDGSLDQTEELLAEVDVVVASVHSKLRMDEATMTKRMVTAIANPHVDILGHCTGQKVPGHMRPVGQSSFAGRVGSSFDADMVFAACAQFGTAVEINARPERQDPPDHLLELALDWNCDVAVSTDAHAPGQLEWMAFGCERAEHHEIPPDRIVNTMAADELLAWTRKST